MFGSGDLGMGVTFSLRDDASAGAENAGRSITNLDRVVSNASTSIQNAASKITSGLVGTVIAVTMLLGPFAEAVATSSEFNFQIARAGAVSRSSAEEIESLRNSALALGNSTVFNATEIAKAEFILAQAGYKANQQVEMLPDLINLATAGVVGLDYAATIASDTMYQFGLATRDMGKISDIIVNAANMSMVSVENFSNAMKYLGPTAKAFGISLEESAAYIEIMANSGMRGSIGTRAFGTSLVNLASPTKQAAELMAQLGFDAYNSSGEFVGLTEMTRRLGSSLNGLTNKERDKAISIIFGNEAIQEMLQLLNLEFTAIENGTEVIYKGADALEYFTQKNREAKGIAEDVASGVMNNFKSDLKLLSAGFETLKITMGSILEGPLRPMVMWIRSLVQSITSFISTKIGSYLLIVAAGAAGLMSALVVLGFVFTVLTPAVWSMVTAMAALVVEFLPFIAIGALVVGAIVFIKEAFDDLQNTMDNQSTPATGFMGVMQKIASVVMAVMEVWSTWNGKTYTLSEDLHNHLERIGILDFVLNLATWIVRIKEFFIGFVEGAAYTYAVFESFFNYMMASVGDLVDSIEQLGFPIRKLTGDLDLFRGAGQIASFVIDVLITPFIALAAAISMVSNAIEFLIVNWRQIQTIGGGFFSSLLTGNPSDLIQAISTSDFTNTFANKGKVLPGRSSSTGNFDFAQIANRQAEIMALTGLRRDEAPTTANPMGPSQETFNIQNFLDGDLISERVINKMELKQARK